jgi:DNA primase catalytic subunit
MERKRRCGCEDIFDLDLDLDMCVGMACGEWEGER